MFNYFMIREPLLESNQFPTQLEADATGDVKKVTRAIVNQHLKHPIIREAILLASPSLHNSLQNWQDAFDKDTFDKRSLQVERSVLKYLSRMTNRTTPFGLLAGIRDMPYKSRGDTTSAGSHSRSSQSLSGLVSDAPLRLDYTVILALVQELEESESAFRMCRFLRAGTALQRGDRWYVIARTSHGLQERIEASIRATPAVNLILSQCARQWAYIEDIHAMLMQYYPAIEMPGVVQAVRSLWDAGLIITDVRPPLTAEDPLDHLLEWFEQRDCNIGLYSKLATIRQHLDDANAKQIGRREESIDKCLSLLKGLIPEAHSRICVDSAFNINWTHPPDELASIAHDAAVVLARLNPVPAPRPAWASYVERFETTYGEEAVDLLELIDVRTGLGVPADYEHSDSRLRDNVSTVSTMKRDAYLFDLLQRRDLKHELLLSEHDITAMTSNSNWAANVPPTSDIFLKPVCGDDEDDYLIAPRTSTDRAGKSFARFHSLLNADTVRQIRTANRSQQNGVMLADISYLPNHARMLNVAGKPQTFEHELIFDVGPSVDLSHVIRLEDISVRAVNGELWLLERGSGKRIVATSNTLLSYERAPDAIRLIEDITLGGVTTSLDFYWGALSTLPHLPRLKYGRLILSEERWLLSSEELRRFGRPGRANYSAIQRWRADNAVTRFVEIGSHDARLLIDLDNPLFVDILLQEAWSKGSEPLIAHRSGILSEGRKREYVVPVDLQHYRNGGSNGSPSTIGNLDSGSEVQVFFPGSEWMSFKLYFGKRHIIDALQAYVFRLVDDIKDEADSWFFIRYADPQPHVRLRFRVKDKQVRNRLIVNILDALEEHTRQGTLHRYEFVAYERELTRYGGLGLIDACERFFHLDSEFVRAKSSQISGLAQDELVLQAAANSIVFVVEALDGNLVGALEYVKELAEGEFALLNQDRELVRQFLRINRERILHMGHATMPLVSYEEGSEGSEHFGAEALQQLRIIASAESDAQRFLTIVASLIHMHHNRMGLERSSEVYVYKVLEHALAYRLHNVKHVK